MVRLTREQVRRIDKRAVEQYKMSGVILMENAARAASDVAIEMLGSRKGKILLLCGGGNNGGDGLAIARHLHNRGIELQILLTADPAKYQGEALINWQIVRAMNLPAAELDLSEVTFMKPALLIDAIFGTGLKESPRPPFAEIVRAVAGMGCLVLAIDIPSGMDCDTGKPLGACINANRTITFVAEKIGFAQPGAAEYTGKITIGDIGCPRELIEQVHSANIASP